MQHPVSRIPCNKIKLDPFWSLHPWALEEVPTYLRQQFEKNGVLHPPIVLAGEGKKEKYQIVSGHRRIHFLQNSIGTEQIHCTVLPDTSPKRLILNLLLIDQQSSNELSLAEKARFLQIAENFYLKEEVRNEFMTAVGFKKSQSLQADLVSLLDEPRQIIVAAHNGDLSEKILSDFMRLPSTQDRVELVALFLNLKLGGGKQKRFLTLIKDAAYKKEQSIATFLRSKDIVDITAEQALNIPQKIQRLGDFLIKKIFPTFSKTEKDYHTKVKALNLPPNYQLIHSPAFEKDEVTLSIRFSTLKEAEGYLKQ